MTEAHHQFGRVTSIRATSVGRPGSRRFRLLIEARTGASAVVWLEKEQLFNLALALKNLIAQAEESQSGKEQPDAQEEAHGATPASRERLDFPAGRLAVGYDPNAALFILTASDAQEANSALPLISLTATQQDMDTLAEEAFEVCAAGRPLCPLCGAPTNPGEKHVCPKHNGHAPLGDTQES
ncbi:MAG: DUF3090 family protein [Chloroflexi bacterium]|nr:DUF3090 family protein [Chloroflexota bacterium]